MFDKGKIILGILIFAVLFTSPLWLNIANDVKVEELKLQMPEDETECIDSKEYMRAFHMDVLNEWRDKVVREDIRFTEINGKQVEMSLSKTCLKCHTSKVEFCDKCHNLMGVDPYCWDCHIAPEEAALQTNIEDIQQKEQLEANSETTPSESLENSQTEKEVENE